MNGRQVQAVEEARFDEVDWSWERPAVRIVDALLAGGLDSSATIGLRALVRARKDLVKHRIALTNRCGPMCWPSFLARWVCSPISTRRSA